MADGIDIIKLFVSGSDKKWVAFLNHCFSTKNIDMLCRTRRELQKGMDNLAKQKLNTPQICELFIRWQKSIENTARAIIRARHPFPNDNSLSPDHLKTMHLEAKRARDRELEFFYKKSSY